MAYLVAFWSTLTQAFVNQWNAHAAAHDHTTPWGAIRTLSGYQWFLCCNLYHLHRHPNALYSPSAWVPYSPPDQFTIETSATYIRAAWSPAYTPTHLFLYISLPLRQSSLKLRRSLFYVGSDVAGGARNNLEFTAKFEAIANVVWAVFYASANCSIIIRIQNGDTAAGWLSSYTSAIIKVS